MITAEAVKRKARELGADVVAIGNTERWEGAPIQQDPRQIMPEARSTTRGARVRITAARWRPAGPPRT